MNFRRSHSLYALLSSDWLIFVLTRTHKTNNNFQDKKQQINKNLPSVLVKVYEEFIENGNGLAFIYQFCCIKALYIA